MNEEHFSKTFDANDNRNGKVIGSFKQVKLRYRRY